MKISLNPNKEEVERIRRALQENDGYCPCKLVKTPETKCMCQEFRRQEEGYCHCGLYIKEKQMEEILVSGKTLPEAYHKALSALSYSGELVPCPDYNTRQVEASLTMKVEEPLAEPRISRLFVGGPSDLEQYIREMLDGILDFEIYKGNWKYTYHDRMTNYYVDDSKNFPETHQYDQIKFIIEDLRRNPYSRRAVIDVRDNSEDAYSDDPACLQHLQFFIRDNKLHCKVLFRSNDACKATFMNAYALIMLQKRIADCLGIEVGTYVHRANSFHCYERDFQLLEKYVNRIETSEIEDLTYNYEGDWDWQMAEELPKIMKKVEKLKGGVK